MAQSSKEFKFSQKTLRLKGGGQHTATIIWMHGLGDTSAGWSAPLQAIIKKLTHIDCVLPTAPLLPITFQGGQQTTAWHDIEDLQNLNKNTFKYKKESRKLIFNLINNEIEMGISSDRIMLGGFSQGAAMSLYSGLTYPQKLGGIIAFSGYLCEPNVIKQISKNNKNIPIIMYHGNQDMIVQTQYGELSAQLLKANGCNITWKTFDISMAMNFGHNVVQEELTLMAKFVAQTIPSSKNNKNDKNDKTDNDEQKKDDKNTDNPPVD